jgi:hypothetical protein
MPKKKCRKGIRFFFMLLDVGLITVLKRLKESPWSHGNFGACSTVVLVLRLKLSDGSDGSLTLCGCSWLLSIPTWYRFSALLLFCRTSGQEYITNWY